MLLSIIIPIYKVEKYVRGTLESIYSQKFDEHDFEVICVNDGTPDNSMQIVNEFANRHSNLHIVNQRNQGLSCARNAGLRIAKGDYIWFVDSDDTIACGSLYCLKNYLCGNPIVEIWGFDIVRVQESSGEETIERIVLRNKDANLYTKSVNYHKLIHKAHVAPVQRFVFKHDFLDRCNLSFRPGILHEDIEFMIRALFLAKSVVMINYSPYRYLVRTSGSIMSSINIRSVYSRLEIINSLLLYKRENVTNYSDKIYFNDNMFLQVLSILYLKKVQSSDYNKLIKENISLFRKLAFRGVIANLYYWDIRKVLKGMIVMINPFLIMK